MYIPDVLNPARDQGGSVIAHIRESMVDEGEKQRHAAG